MRGGDEWAGALLERRLCVCCISCDQCRKYERYEPVGGSGGAVSSCGGVFGGSDGGGYASVIYCEETDILKQCVEHFPEADVSAVSEIQVTERDAAGYVQQVMLGEYACTGEALREAMGWNSACFTITQLGKMCGS